MKKSILLIRHAQSANNALPEPQRVSDPGLTELGHQQAERLARGLSRFTISQLYCSPFRRSLDTTLPISVHLGIRPTIKADIYEQGGCYSGYQVGKLRGEPGMCCNQLAAAYPDWEIDPLIGPRGWNVDREYEDFAGACERAARVTAWLIDHWQPLRPNSLAALVIHADFKRVLMEELLQTDRWSDSHQEIWNTGVSHLQFDGQRWELLKWNAVDHLPEDLRT